MSGVPGSSGFPEPAEPPTTPGTPDLSGVTGLLGSVRGLVDGVVGSVHDRVELFSLELQEEKHRLVQSFLWATVFVVCATLAVLFASALLVVACWNTAARIPLVAGLALGYGVATAVIGWRLRATMRRQPRPFAGTLEELRLDRSCLPPKR